MANIIDSSAVKNTESTTCFVCGLPKDTTKEALQKLCEPFGTLLSVKFDPRGNGLVQFMTITEVKAACEALDHSSFEGRRLTVSQLAIP